MYETISDGIELRRLLEIPNTVDLRSVIPTEPYNIVGFGDSILSDTTLLYHTSDQLQIDYISNNGKNFRRNSDGKVVYDIRYIYDPIYDCTIKSKGQVFKDTRSMLIHIQHKYNIVPCAYTSGDNICVSYSYIGTIDISVKIKRLLLPTFTDSISNVSVLSHNEVSCYLLQGTDNKLYHGGCFVFRDCVFSSILHIIKIKGKNLIVFPISDNTKYRILVYNMKNDMYVSLYMDILPVNNYYDDIITEAVLKDHPYILGDSYDT